MPPDSLDPGFKRSNLAKSGSQNDTVMLLTASSTLETCFFTLRFTHKRVFSEIHILEMVLLYSTDNQLQQRREE